MTAVTLSGASRLAPLPIELPLELGGVLEDGVVGFELIEPSGAAPGVEAPLVIVQGGISAGRHAAASADNPSPGWWEAIVGPDRAIDTGRWRVLATDWLGGGGISSGPESSGLGTAFPQITSQDQARAIAAVLDRLGIERAHAFVGASYGGMVALAFGALFPDRVGRLAVLGAAHESWPLASAWRAVQRRILEWGLESGEEARAVELARMLAMTTYRGAAELAERFRGDPQPAPDGLRAPIETYLEGRGRAWSKGVGAASYRLLSCAIDLARVRPEEVRVPATLVAFDSDRLVPPEQVRECARRLGAPARVVELSTRYGHDGFLKEPEAVGRVLRTCLEERSGENGAARIAARAGAAGTRPARRNLATLAARAGVEADPLHGAVMPPLHLSVNYAFEGFGRKRAYDYTRTANPTRDLLAGALAELEGGAGAVVTSSGMAAVTLVLQLLQAGELVVAPHDGYGGTWRLLRALERRGERRVLLVDQRDDQALERALAERPRLLWIETPSNPLLRLTDIAAVAERGRAAGALVAVDNTFLSPALQQPLDLGADLAVHSTTKYLNGHSDVVGGAVVARDGELAGELAWWANCLGLTGAPFDSWLTLRGLRTLGARLRVQQESAQVLAERLASHPAVLRVHYPGLAAHPERELALRQQTGPGAMLSFELKDGEPAVRALLEGLACFSLAESLGGVESLVAHPATMTHASMDAAARERAGITSGLLRLSIGLEDVEDLLGDLEAGLERAAAVG
jgi:cystathionine gamma-synthase